MVVVKDEKRHLLKLLSILFQYPDEELIESSGELKEAVEQIYQAEHRERCGNFLFYLGSNPLIRLQEEYTGTFDICPATCLNLTYHRWGDAKQRGSAMVAFRDLYYTCGYETMTGELPDYLPLVLEFLSVSRQESHPLLEQYCDQVETIRSRLEEKGSPYAALFEVVVDIFRELKANGV